MYAMGKPRGPLNFPVFSLKTSKVIWKNIREVVISHFI